MAKRKTKKITTKVSKVGRSHQKKVVRRKAPVKKRVAKPKARKVVKKSTVKRKTKKVVRKKPAKRKVVKKKVAVRKRVVKRKAVSKKSSSRRRVQKKSDWPVKWVAAPSKNSFMILAIIGFFISAYLVFPESSNFGLALMLVFAAMFISSIISSVKAPLK